MLRVSLGFLILIVDITTEETRTATCSRAKGRRACNSSDDCSATRPNSTAAQYPLLGIRHAGTPNGKEKCNQEQGYRLPHFFLHHFEVRFIITALLGLTMPGQLKEIHGQNDHFHVVHWRHIP